MGRITVTIDPQLIEDAQVLLGTSTKRQTIEQALLEIVQMKKRENALRRRGQLDLNLDQEGLSELRRQS